MGIFNKSTQKNFGGANLSVADLDKLMDLAVNGTGQDPWGSSYYKGIVKKIASTVRVIPRRFTTLDGKTVIEERDLDVEIKLNDILAQSSIALNRFGKAYWGIDTSGSNVVGARWFNPATITEKEKSGIGLVAFTRGNSKEDKHQIVYTYDTETKRAFSPDNGAIGWVWSLGMNEIGPGDTLDDDVGLPASLLNWADLMMAQLFKRGGINKWVAFTDHNPPKKEQERIRNSINRMLGKGVEGSSTFEVLSNLLEMKQVGTDPKDLEMEVVNTGNKSDVSAGTLTPQILINPDMASNRSVMDRVTASWLSDVVVPHANLIVEALNHHVFNPAGIVMEFQPNAMGADQQDEVDRAQAWGIYVERGANPNTTAAMLGLNVPEGMELMLPPPTQQIDQATMMSLVSNEINKAMIDFATKAFAIPGEVIDTKPLEPSPEWKDERRQFKAWYTKRGFNADVSKFTAHHLTDDDKAIVIGEVLQSDLWEGY